MVAARACRLGQSGSPRSGKRTDSLEKVENSHACSSRCGFVAQWLERATRIRKILGAIPAGLRCVFSSDPAVSSSIFVGAEREKNLIGRKTSFAISPCRTLKSLSCERMY